MRPSPASQILGCVALAPNCAGGGTPGFFGHIKDQENEKKSPRPTGARTMRLPVREAHTGNDEAGPNQIAGQGSCYGVGRDVDQTRGGVDVNEVLYAKGPLSRSQNNASSPPQHYNSSVRNVVPESLLRGTSRIGFRTRISAIRRPRSGRRYWARSPMALWIAWPI